MPPHLRGNACQIESRPVAERMTSNDDVLHEITAQVLLKAYSCGIFPMAEAADDPALYWIEPQARGILPLNAVHVPRRLARTVRQDVYEVRTDTSYDGVIEGCSKARAGRESTWINARIRALYAELFAMGHCHTIECWHEGALVGGLYGVALGGAFFGESMFSEMRDASKVALVHLAARLNFGGFVLLDCQFQTHHLAQFGTVEIGRQEFQDRLDRALLYLGDWHALGDTVSGARALEVIERAHEDARPVTHSAS